MITKKNKSIDLLINEKVTIYIPKDGNFRKL